MSEWKKVKLGEISDSCLGKMLDAVKNRGEYQPYLANLNVRWGSFDLDNLSTMRFEEHEEDRYGIKYGDLIICEGGEPGRCAIWKDQMPNMKIQKALHRVRGKKDIIDNFYLFYWFLFAGKRGYIDQYCTGATIKHLPGQKLKEIVIDLPPLATQHRIATILSRYDSLIENYQKQIKLLEEAAQRLYKEWFIDLRFPGYENANIVDGVPEGWEKKKLEDFCNVFTGKKNANAAEQNGKYKFFTCSDTPLKINSFIYDGAAILISGNGSYTGRTTFYEGKFDLYQRTYACTIKENVNPILIYGLYEAVKCELTTQISGGTHGAAIPYIVMADVTQFNFLYNEYVMLKFSEIMNCNLSQNLSLQSQLRLLTEARDRLLPKLMSGEIEV
ncbi:MAG: restriction endonuclease subunit S [Bacteroidaceae bacterium]|nr:restriction endonuclease subunit S [Bacteroidaceae bacterium]